VGQRTGRRWLLGDSVHVRLNRVDLTQRQIDFELLDADGATGHGTVRAPRRGAGGGGDGGQHARRGPGSVSGRGGGSQRGGRGGGAKRGRGGRG
jgi:hypothetical protein